MKTQDRIRVLIVESTPQVTKQLRKLLNLMDNVEILKDVRTGQEAIHEIRESKPEVAIVDINLADVNGLNLTEMIRRDLPMTQVVVVSEDKYYDTVLRAMRNGASDFVTHDATLDELSLAISRAGEIAQQDKMKVHTFDYKDFEGPQPPSDSGPQNGKIITVLSPKGGTGVTTIAGNLAIALQDSDKTVAIVDSSMQFGDVAILLNEMGKFSVLDLMPRIYELDTKVIEDVMLLHKSSGLRVLKAPVRPELAEQVTGSNLTKETALDEKGGLVNGRTETPNMHDILTGSRPDGSAFPGAPFPDMTCGNWTKGGPDGSAMTGHHDRVGPLAAPWATSWNSAHPTLGCSMEKIRPTGGDGRFYCFAAK